MGRLHEGKYFCFCLDHVREYNASYNYFHGMSDEAVALFQQEALVGHRPTWSMGVRRGPRNFREESDNPSRESPRIFRAASPRYSCDSAPKKRYGLAAMRALEQLGLDDTVDMAAIKARYKDLVKRLHPDANSGDRSNEEKLREIIRAYRYLTSLKQA
ncbi:MAG TPA: DnaJ domain-containing protein [Methylocella sp.]|nr:DnaJ domain-containing protein [Methylocella sp.]